jgi:hypothetical protein
MYEVLDHNPTHQDIERFFSRFQAALDLRGLVLRGITTDASPLYPEPIRRIFGGVRHQVCQFHILAELSKAVLRALAKIRKERRRTLPKLPRGRPMSPSAKQEARRIKRAQVKVAELYDHRHLFVRKDLTDKEQRTLRRITRGQPELRSLRAIMDEVYRLFDRRCKTETALQKLSELRERVGKFKGIGRTLQKLFSPNLEKALAFLDDSLLPATSNGVERGNRRHRKMQKSIYRVRTHRALVCRMALDLLRDWQRAARREIVAALHKARAG